jgi:hypothetical protein
MGRYPGRVDDGQQPQPPLPPHIPTRAGEHGQRDTVIDLVLWNLAAAWSDQFYFDHVSFNASLGSDHAAMIFTWAPALYIPPAPSDPSPRWIVHDSMMDLWQEHFLSLVPSNPSSKDPQTIATSILQVITESNDFCFDRPLPLPKGCGARWWNDACGGSLAQLRSAPPGNRKDAFRYMRQTIRTAKRDWAETVLTEATNNQDQNALWAVAKWRKGRSNPIIPPIRTADNEPVRQPCLDVRCFLNMLLPERRRRR